VIKGVRNPRLSPRYSPSDSLADSLVIGQTNLMIVASLQ